MTTLRHGRGYLVRMRWSVPFLGIALMAMTAKGQVDSVAADFPRGYPGSFHRDEVTLLTGYHQGRYGFAELGIGRSIHGAVHHPYGVGYHLGAELRVDRPALWGLKVGAYATGGFALGLHYVHYMEGAESTEVLRPEYGIGIFKAKVTYAYNIQLTKPRIEGLSTHMLSLSYAFRVKRLPRDDQRKAAR